MTDFQTPIKIINPFTDIMPPVYPDSAVNTDFGQFSMGGGGDNGLKADEQGMWFGARFFKDAPFKTDMLGNVTINSLIVVGGTIRYGKTSFSDSTHLGYYIGNEGIYMGSAADATLFKFTIASGLIDHVGTISNRSTATIAAAINASGEATAIINNLVTTLKIADSQVTAAKTSIASINPVDGEINANKVGTTQINANAVTEGKILNSAITENKIATNAVTEGKIYALSVTAGKIATGAITADKILAGAVTAVKITSYNFMLSAGSFTNNSPGAGRLAWTGCKVVYNGTEYAITNGNCLSTEKHIYWQLSNPNIFQTSVSLPALGNDDFLVTFNNGGTAVYTWNSTVINGNRITAGTVTATQISAHSITANEIAATTITASEIAASTITAAKMNVATLSAISANLGTITAGTVTGATIQTDSGAYPNVIMNSSGIKIHGQNFELRATDGGLYGYIGGFGGYYNITTYNNRNMLIDVGSATVHITGAAIAPLNHGGSQLGYYNYAWANVYAFNFAFNNSQYFNTSGSNIVSNSDFYVAGSVTITGNMTFSNYASITCKDSGGTSRVLTCKLNATLGVYILST